ncbi:MAG TPA: aldo/keto reductase [Gaiellaceae bacterium]|jgi:aryl-alcohol dehydrogenase-like predicted oxidoreductase
MTERAVRIGDREVARIGLGTNRLSRSSRNRTFIQDAAAAGIGLIDTAHLYTSGDSETTIGQALESLPDRPIVATKGGFSPGQGRPEVLRAQIEESLRLLRVETIDLYYLHRVDPETPMEDSLGTIAEYVERGAIRHVGISEVDVDQVEQARRLVEITAVQNRYSLVERTHEDVVDHCTAEGIVFVPFFPLRGVGSRELDRIAADRGASPQQVALAWLLKRSPVMLPIPGTLSIEHLQENLGALDVELSDEEFETLG